MSELHPSVTGRKLNQRSETSFHLQPLLVSVREARRLLGGISNNTFWKLVKAGEFAGGVMGTPRKRWITIVSLEAYVARQVERQRSAHTNPPPAAEARS
jgi:hypothetical protein